ncbi:1-acyl-sn-glycerol-3-phosphate acyltransferase alpha isoform X2 [Venturia canescens]|uniref:1-acyl-sn-glycerol-3-phosphate acyltransferase alpha isoform X2 n=1 Tax=Venturia canescens TaxID=32260 RepID=UPI001C9CF316|nr:1-acyl-sn-glycerol-3-phosphate acyltransferase alpha isoform X2 [Venturia canescens]
MKNSTFVVLRLINSTGMNFEIYCWAENWRMLGGVSCSSIGVALFVLLVAICAVSEGARYRAKFLVFIVLSAIAATWSIPLMLRRPRDWRNALIPAWGARQIAKLLGVNFKVRGQENVVKDTGAVVLINHQSAIDLCVLAELWPVLERCTVVSKRLVLYFGTFGLACWLWGTIFIDRSNVTEAQETINSTADTINRRKAKLLLFPEGKRYNGTSLMPFKKGAFHVAVRAQTPIQPVVVSKYYFLNDEKKKFEPGTSYITILPPIPTKGLTKEDIPTLMDKTWEVMNSTFQETSREILVDEKVKSLSS